VSTVGQNGPAGQLLACNPACVGRCGIHRLSTSLFPYGDSLMPITCPYERLQRRLHVFILRRHLPSRPWATYAGWSPAL
jgi:hypothetical protein